MTKKPEITPLEGVPTASESIRTDAQAASPATTPASFMKKQVEASARTEIAPEQNEYKSPRNR